MAIRSNRCHDNDAITSLVNGPAIFLGPSLVYVPCAIMPATFSMTTAVGLLFLMLASRYFAFTVGTTLDLALERHKIMQGISLTVNG